MYGDLKRCPIVLKGYQYYANLVVAELRPTVSAILGMKFLTAYGAEIDLEVDQFCLKAGTVINTLLENCTDRIPVRLCEDCVLLAGHLNRCPSQVADAMLERGETSLSLRPTPCVVQAANLRHK